MTYRPGKEAASEGATAVKLLTETQDSLFAKISAAEVLDAASVTEEDVEGAKVLAKHCDDTLDACKALKKKLKHQMAALG